MLVIGAKQIGMSKITQAARQMNFPEEKLLGDWIVCIPGFTLEKYRRLQRSRLSIFSRNCFGSILYNTLGLSFNSPFKNLLMEEQDFIQFLRHPRLYMEEELEFKEKLFYEDGKHDYPVFKLGDISVHMLHYRIFDEAVIKWNERRKKINWYNLFVVMETQDEEILRKFDALPYGKKICFVPFKSDLDSAWYINPETQSEPVYTTLVLNYAWGKIFYYDPFDMLLYGKKTPLIKM